MAEFRLPDLGEGVTEGEVVEWRVRPGAAVARDQILCVVGTDKATVEIPSPLEGTVDAILAAEGQVVRVGDALLRIAGGDDGIAVVPEPPGDLLSAPSAAAAQRTAGPELPTGATGPRPPALPSVRRTARERGLRLEQVEGSGPGGRVRMADLDRNERRVPLRGARRVMAERMAEAHRRVPQVTVALECAMEPVEELVRQHAEAGPGRPSILGLISLAARLEVSAQPIFNSSFDEDSMELVYHPALHLGIAVQTEQGLKVATIRDADRLPKPVFQSELDRVVAAARDGSLQPPELAGATFTISSGGRLGGLLATPMVNWPNVATLGIHEIEDRPVVRSGRVEVGRCAHLTISFDHRVIDGMTASAFLYSVRARLADPATLLGPG